MSNSTLTKVESLVSSYLSVPQRIVVRLEAMGWDAHEWKGNQEYDAVRYELSVPVDLAFDPRAPVPPISCTPTYQVVAKHATIGHPVEGSFDVINTVVEYVQEEYSQEMRLYVFSYYDKIEKVRIIDSHKLQELRMQYAHGVITVDEYKALSSTKWLVWTFKIAGLEKQQGRALKGLARMENI